MIPFRALECHASVGCDPCLQEPAKLNHFSVFVLVQFAGIGSCRLLYTDKRRTVL